MHYDKTELRACGVSETAYLPRSEGAALEFVSSADIRKVYTYVMNENPPITPEEKKLESLEGRKFAFPGISERYNATLSAERAECQEYFLGTWDELTEKFKTQGMKVHTGKNGEIYILPGDSIDVENDGIMPRHLDVSEDMDQGLKELIMKNQK